MSLSAGYNPREALDLMRASYFVDLVASGREQPGSGSRLAALSNPFDWVDTEIAPSPIRPVLPERWEVLTTIRSRLKNTAMLAWDPDREVHCLAFAGTVNPLNALQDDLIWPVSAGPLSAEGHQRLDLERLAVRLVGADAPTGVKADLRDFWDTTATFVTGRFSSDERALVHLGFRLAFESLSWKPSAGAGHPTLAQALEDLPGERLELLVTGHSLGGAMASLCAAWLLAGNLKKPCDVKCYTFASPKPGNDAFASSYDLALTDRRRSFRVFNNLDTVPQLPLTLGLFQYLNNPQVAASLGEPIFALVWLAMSHRKGGLAKHRFRARLVERVIDWFSEKVVAWLRRFPLPDLDYTHVGSPMALDGSRPVVFAQDRYPAVFFDGVEPTPEVSDMNKQWWQHMMWVYLELLLDQESVEDARRPAGSP